MNVTKRDALVVGLLVAAAGLACKGSKGTDDANDTEVSASDDKPTKQEERANGKTDPKIDALAAKILECEWMDRGFRQCSEPEKALNTSDLVKDGKAEETFLLYIEDDSPQKRWIGAEGLQNAGGKHRTEAAPAKRLLAAAKTEKEAAVADELAEALAKVDLEKTGLGSEVIALAKGHPLDVFRQEYFRYASVSNAQGFDAAVATAKADDNPDVRRAAFGVFWASALGGREAEVCALWLDRAKRDPVEANQTQATYLLFYKSRAVCEPQYDEALGIVEQVGKAGKAQSSQWGSSLKFLLKQETLSAAHKQRAIAVAKVLLENTKNDAMGRSYAVELIAEHDPGAKPYLAKFAGDQSTWVKDAVAKALAGK